MCRRYASKVAGLRDIFSEFGLIKRRVLVEIRWLQQLAAIPEVTEVPPFSEEANQLLNSLAESFSVEDALEVKQVCTANCIAHHHHALTCFSSPSVMTATHALAFWASVTFFLRVSYLYKETGNHKVIPTQE